MRVRTGVLSLFLAAPLVLFATNPQSPGNLVLPSQILQRALVALVGNQQLTDITLNGTARQVAGGNEESGPASLKATLVGSRIDLNLPSGTLTEIRNASGTQPVGVWSKGDATTHALAGHNLFTEPSWFSPQLFISRRLNFSYQITIVGAETRDAKSVEHLSIIRPISDTSDSARLIERLSQHELYLDSSTFMPLAVTFNEHPDDNANLDIAIEIAFADYRKVSGVQLPFHIQRFRNRVLDLDFQVDSASINSGLPATTFAVPQQ
jgi:hypothetical protein